MIPQHPTWSDLTNHVSLDMGAQIISLDTIPKPNAVSAGPAVLSLSNGVVNARNYVAYWQAGSFFIRGESPDGTLWEDPVLLGSITGVPVTMTLTFDQLGRAQVFYELDGVIWFYGYDTISQTIKSIEICPGITPVAAMDYPSNTSRATCDIILAYVINQKVEFRQQRDKYATAYPTPINNPGPNLRLTEAGFRKDRRFGITYAYDLATPGGPSEHASYVLGTWKWRDRSGDLFWAQPQVDGPEKAVIWDNGEAQLTMILGCNTTDNLPAPTTLSGFNWSVVIDNDPEYQPTAWLGVGFGQYAGRTDPSTGFAQAYDVTFEFKTATKTVKVAVLPDVNSQYGDYALFEVAPNGSVATTPVVPVLYDSSWRVMIEQTDGTFLPGGYSVERFTMNLWFSELHDTWFPGDFTDYVDLKQVGTIEVTAKAIHKAGTSPDLIGYMKFTATGAP